MSCLTTDWIHIINSYDENQDVKFRDFVNNEVDKYDDLLGVYPSREIYSNVSITLIFKKQK